MQENKPEGIGPFVSHAPDLDLNDQNISLRASLRKDPTKRKKVLLGLYILVAGLIIALVVGKQWTIVQSDEFNKKFSRNAEVMTKWDEEIQAEVRKALAPLDYIDKDYFDVVDRNIQQEMKIAYDSKDGTQRKRDLYRNVVANMEQTILEIIAGYDKLIERDKKIISSWGKDIDGYRGVIDETRKVPRGGLGAAQFMNGMLAAGATGENAAQGYFALRDGAARMEDSASRKIVAANDHIEFRQSIIEKERLKIARLKKFLEHFRAQFQQGGIEIENTQLVCNLPFEKPSDITLQQPLAAIPSTQEGTQDLDRERAQLQKQIDDANLRKAELEKQMKPTEPKVPESSKPQPNEEAIKPATTLDAPALQQVQATVPGIEAARVTNQAAPTFPSRALQANWQSGLDHVVRLKVFVGEQGQPLKVGIVEGVPGSFGFDEAAIEAANKSSYRPSTRDGKPVRGWTAEIVYKFSKRR